MSYNGVDQIDYMVDDGGDVADSLDEEHPTADDDDDANLDEYDMLMKVTDTSSSQAREGKDIQGIPWDRLNITRETYRLTRLQQYRNYVSLPSSSEEGVDKGLKPAPKGGNYFEFFHNTRLVKPTILHFQLRNLVWATSKHDVYLISNYSVMHWSSLHQSLTEVLDFSGHIVPTERYPGTLLEGFTRTQLSTLAVKDRFLVAGGFHGELVCKCLDKPGVSFCTRTTHHENAITNSIEIFDDLSGLHFMTSNNDCGVREYDLERFQLLNHFRFPWPVNNTSMSPDRKLISIVGDDRDGLLVDARNGKTVASVVGHQDYSFASAWHPDGRVLATGNQDKTCRVWDLRNLSSPTAILKGNMGAVRSMRFSNDGEFMVVAEPADFVHVYSTRENYETRQELDFFGEISGVSLSPDDESLCVGIWDRTYASLLQYNRKHTYQYLDSLM
ncbi:hypothetical protein ACS0TY_023507 [Phlomoides rotata]